MTNYTPDTGEVRNAYGSHVGYCHRATKDGLAEFDRWFAEEIRKARAEGWTEGYWQGINGYTGPGNPYTLPNNTTIPYTEES